MRLLRAFAYLVLAFAVMTASVGQAAVLGAMAHGSPRHHVQEAPVVDRAGHEHATTTDDSATHKRDACQTACCFTPGQVLGRPGDVGVVEFFCSVRYPDVARPMMGRAWAPDPGVPKLAA